MPNKTLSLPPHWNKTLLEAIVTTKTPPPQTARILAIFHTAMFDAWAAYERRALSTRSGGLFRRPAAERTDPNRAKAISYAALTVMNAFFGEDAGQPHQKMMANLGFAADDRSDDLATPVGIGRRAALAVLDFRKGDGSNALHTLGGAKFYADWTGYAAAVPPGIGTGLTDENSDRWQPLSKPVPELPQAFLVAHWPCVQPFAMPNGAFFRPVLPPASGRSAKMRDQANDLLKLSANLSDEQKAITEYWMDGPASVTPPGHWCELAAWVCERDELDLGQSIRLFFALSNALLDASIAAWDCKRHFDYCRPITLIRHLFRGKTIQSWGGKGKGTVSWNGENWLPYQKTASITPPFPEFVSGHSTFSAAAAGILRRFTGSDFFGHSARIEKLVIEEIDLLPTVELKWQTFTEAADEAGMSRRFGGIHFEEGDLHGRQIGEKVAGLVWKKAAALWEGTL